VARNVDATQAQVAIAWLIAHPSITAPIASATRLTQLGELITAAELKLRDSDIALLNKASA
jgi:aryl-alcohol dehydrogenase-like predicted oxidoreductase